MKNNNEIIEPKQQRSIEKKNKIITAGMQLFSERGYHNTNTAEIAKAAGVSTGIVYRYFNDKHDIIISGLRLMFETGFGQYIHFQPDMKKKYPTLRCFITFLIDNLLEIHTQQEQLHNLVMSLYNSDEEVKKILIEVEQSVTENLIHIFKIYGYSTNHSYEKIHMIYNMTETFCHEVVYHKHEEMNADYYKELILSEIINILEKE